MVFVFFVYVTVCPSGPTQYLLHTPTARHSLYQARPINSCLTIEDYDNPTTTPGKIRFHSSISSSTVVVVVAVIAVVKSAFNAVRFSSRRL